MHCGTVVGCRAAQAFAVDRQDAALSPAWRVELVGKPCAHRDIQPVSIDTPKHPAEGCLVGATADAGQRVAAHPERGQDRLGLICYPFPNRGDRAGTGQHRRSGHGQHADQRMAQAPTGTRIANHSGPFQQPGKSRRSSGRATS
jgi:hypothetical protein